MTEHLHANPVHSQIVPEEGDLERENAKLRKINAALIQRVEKSMDQQANAYSLFQTAITLEGQVRGRTEELKSALERLERANDELLAARDAAERANRVKTRFFTAVGHDLLQPLHAARLTCSAMAEPSANASQHRLADRIEHALTTIEELLISILDISKLEAGAISPSLRPVSLNEMFASLVLDIEPLAREKNLSLTWRQNDFSVYSDPLMLRRILQNLLANAVQYTERGGIKLAARRRGAHVRIEVWDTGPGIPATQRELIFEEFRRAPSTDRPLIGGFGLGLSIVQRMAEALNHPLDLCSLVDHGTRFSITAPFSGIAEQRTSYSGTTSRAASYGLNGAKVVVIDNDRAVLEAMQSLLESWQCEAYLLRDLGELEELVDLQTFAPDIVLADYHLDHDTCGITAVDRLRAATGHSIPAIVVTADHAARTSDEVRASGCELLLKPVKPAELRALITHLLSRAGSAQD